MPLLEDLLLRFRRVWAPPGPVTGQAGVPADLDARIENELQQLTVQLAGFEAESEAVVHDAQLRADAIIAAARAAAEHDLVAARSRLSEVRARSALARASRREADIARLMETAEREAEAVRVRAGTHRALLVEAAVDEVFAGLPARDKEDRASAVGGG